jgi:hypothetical protein
MRSFRLVALAVGAAAFWSGPAFGQFHLGKLGRGGGPSQLLLRPEVQKELNLTSEQIQKAKEVNQVIREDLGDEFAKLSVMTGREGDRKKMELAKQITQRAKNYVKGFLTPDQLKRLNEIAFQAAGVNALKDPDTQAELRMSGDQQKKVMEIMTEAIKDMRILFENTIDEIEVTQKRAGHLRDRAYTQAMAVLSAEQRKQWEEMQGKPFEFKIVDARRPVAVRKEEIKLSGQAMPSADSADLNWVAARAKEWQPTKDEKRFDDIGWAPLEARILGGLKLAKEHNRPLFVISLEGYLHRGRC